MHVLSLKKRDSETKGQFNLEKFDLDEFSIEFRAAAVARTYEYPYYCIFAACGYAGAFHSYARNRMGKY